jgi:hypothetical protein
MLARGEYYQIFPIQGIETLGGGAPMGRARSFFDWVLKGSIWRIPLWAGPF